jgi:hypothetical protein
MGGYHPFDANDVKPQAHQTNRYVFSRSVMREVMYYSFNGFFGLRKSAISFMTILVPLLVFWNSKLPVTKPLFCLCNYIRFVVEVSTMAGGLPDLMDDACCAFLSGFSVGSSTRVHSTSICVALMGAKKFLVGSSPCDHILGSLGPDAVMTVSFYLLACSSDGICLCLPCSQNSSFPSVGSPSVMSRREFFIYLCVAA